MKKFNLAQMLPSLNSGGVEQGTLDVANYLAAKEIKNSIISNGGQMLSYLNKKYVSHHNLSVDSKNILKLLFLANKLNNIINKNKINLLHVRSRGPAWLLPFINKKNLKTISTFHNIYGHQNYFKKIYNKGLANTNCIIAISKYVKKEISMLYKIDEKKIIVINRGIDTNFFNGKIDEEIKFINFIKKNNIESNKKNILFPGRLTEWKGQLKFLDVIEKIISKDYNFYFVGDDKNRSYSKKLKARIKQKNLANKCKILGHLNKYDLKIMYAVSDLVISAPLKAEGFGRTISESLAMKKMLIGYNFGGVKDQLGDLNDIYKINPYDQSELLNRINFILDSPSENFLQIKQNSRDHIINNFSKTQMLKNYNNLYESMGFE